MITISELKNCNSFTITELNGVTITPEGRFGGKETAKYVFMVENANETNEILYVSGDVFGNECYKVLNKGQVLFNIAKGTSFKAIIVDEPSGDNIEFEVYIFDVDLY